MPIRINLLAETQIAEDLRRRDPLKRAILVVILLVGGMLVWSSWVQLKVVMAQSGLSQVQDSIASRTNRYASVLANQQIIAESNEKLAALKELTACRFLQGSLLNALQQTIVPDVQLTRIRVNQTYTATPPVQATSDDSGRVIPGQPGTVTEGIVLVLDAKDSSANPGDRHNEFKAAIANQPYLNTALQNTNSILLTSQSAPQTDPDGHRFVSFTLECHYPNYTR